MKMYIFELLYAIDVIFVLSHSLECQLSFDTLLYMFNVCTTAWCYCKIMCSQKIF